MSAPEHDENGRVYTRFLLRKAKRTAHYLRTTDNRPAAFVIDALVERLEEVAYSDAWAVVIETWEHEYGGGLIGSALYGPYTEKARADEMAERLGKRLADEAGTTVDILWSVQLMTTQKARA